MALESRQTSLYGDNTCYDAYGNQFPCRSAWYDWGRWVALFIVALAFVLLFVILRSARRRRRIGQQPFYGTGWAGRTPWGHGEATYNPNYPQQNQQVGNTGYYAHPPVYTNRGYFGAGTHQQQTETGEGGYELQPPNRTYGGDVYEPPMGPPPKKY